MTIQQNIQDRTIRRSVKEAINEIHSDPIYAYVEAVINAFTAMRHFPAEQRYVHIFLPHNYSTKYVNDAHIIGIGTGFTNYGYIEKNMGYDTDSEEYKVDQRDPDYLNKMGIGIPTIASLSKDGIAEFRSVSKNSKDQEEGLVATYTLKDSGGFIIPAEHPDSKYVFDPGQDGTKVLDIETGVWVIIRNARYYQVDKVYRLLSETFARKLKAGYGIYLYGPAEKGHPRIVLPPEDFSMTEERIIGYVHDDKLADDFPVYADIRPAQKPSEATVRILMKKMTIGQYASEYLAKGYFGCDVLQFKPDREGIIVDPFNSKYMQVEKLVLAEYARQKIEKKPTEQMRNEKRAKRWKQKTNEMFVRYYNKNRLDSLLRVNCMPNATSPLTAKSDPFGKVVKPTRRCPNGYHWDKKTGQCLAIVEPTTPRTPRNKSDVIRGENEPHFGRGRGKKRRAKLDEEYTDQSIPNFRIGTGSDKNRFFVWIDEKESAIFLNTFYSWANDILESANEKTMEILIGMAIMHAVPDNRNLTSDEWLRKLATSL